MESPLTVQDALIALLQADVPLVTALGLADRIKEAKWRGTTFEYPCLRVDFSSASPEGSGNCAEAWASIAATLEVFSKDSSSRECLTLLGLIQNAVQRKRLTAAGMASLEIKIDQTIPPDRDDNVWRGQVLIYSTVIDT